MAKVRPDGTRSIGDGLFSNFSWKKHDHIVTFKGTFIDKAEYNRRVQDGHSGYAIQFNVNKYLDCYANRWHPSTDAELCLASFANCYRNCVYSSTSKVARPNARLKLDTKLNVAVLTCIRNINAHEEILYDYGAASYRTYDPCADLVGLIID